jgi:hypothetical protein
MYRPTKYPSLDKDPRLESVTIKLANLRTLIDEADWQDKPVDTITRNGANRLTHMTNEGTLWLPRF